MTTVIPVRALTFVVALCALVGSACGGGGSVGAAATPPATVTSSDPSSRQPAPEIEGISLEGKRISVADFRGRPVLVNVWSSW
jgi:hypothetical protein